MALIDMAEQTYMTHHSRANPIIPSIPSERTRVDLQFRWHCWGSWKPNMLKKRSRVKIGEESKSEEIQYHLSSCPLRGINRTCTMGKGEEVAS